MLRASLTQMLPNMMHRNSVIPCDKKNMCIKPWWFLRNGDRNIDTFSAIKGVGAKNNTKLGFTNRDVDKVFLAFKGSETLWCGESNEGRVFS